MSDIPRIEKYFTIHENDVGTEAYRDYYVEKLEKELAAANKRIAELAATNKVDLAKLTEAVDLGSKQAKEFDVCIAAKDKKIAELEKDVQKLKKLYENACNYIADMEANKEAK